MRVGINAHILAGRVGGVARYTRCLIEALLRLGVGDYVLFGQRESLAHFSESAAQFALSRLPTGHSSIRILWEQIVLPRQIEGGIDVFHQPDHVGFLCRLPIPFVLTVHDLSFVKCPDTFNFSRRLYKSVMTRLTIRRASHIIADSENTKRDIVELFGASPAKVTAIPLAAHRLFFDDRLEMDSERVRRRYGLPERFILFVGTLEPRKNLYRLLRAFSRVRSTDQNISHSLVLAGERGWLVREAVELLEVLEKRMWVRYIGAVRQDDLPLLYRTADLFVFPSLYEGFGLPPLEAMACGTPVITSKTSSLPEVVGDAAIAIDPYDVDALSEAIRRLLLDEELRDEMRKRGRERAKLFSWEETARRTLKVYEEICAEGKS